MNKKPSQTDMDYFYHKLIHDTVLPVWMEVAFMHSFCSQRALYLFIPTNTVRSRLQ